VEASPRSAGGDEPSGLRRARVARGDRADVAALVRQIVAELGTALGRPDAVAAACRVLERRLERPAGRTEQAVHRVLAPWLGRRQGDLVRPIADLLARAAASGPDPWRLLRALVVARDPGIVVQGVDLGARLAEAGRLPGGAAIVRDLASAADVEGSPLASPDLLPGLARLLRALAGPGAVEPLRRHLTDSPGPVRSLAARVLDAEKADPDLVARRLLDADAHSFLGPYLAYTRAGHADLVELVPVPGEAPPALASLRDAEARLGGPALRRILAEVGWARVNRGFEVLPQVGLSFAGSLPLFVSPAEAALLAEGADARPGGRPFLVVARGGRATTGPGAGDDRARVARFRAYSLLHADALQDLLDFTPLTAERAASVLGRMDRIVAEHVALFSAVADDCAILADVHATLRRRIAARLEGAPPGSLLDAETTRLVQSFEDPPRLADVRTMHGLKRLLHQRSLRLASRLLAGRSTPDRTVDLLRVEDGRVTGRVPSIRWTDLEASSPERDALPPPVRILVEAFARALLHGHREFPSVRIFRYGTEAHYYLTYWSHPAFVRVDYAPPLRGGLVDLEYFGVSKSELDQHPAPQLDAIHRFLKGAEFDVEVEATHVHARYDKERALDAGDVARKASTLFRLAPYLMDLDWTLGSLHLAAEARRRAIDAWERFLACHGVLPVARLLTSDRTGILLRTSDGPSGRREEAWSGEGPCPVRFPDAPPAGLAARWDASLTGLGVEAPSLRGGALRSLGQLEVEQVVLEPLREALARGELRELGGRLVRRGRDLYRSVHETELLAAMLGSSAATATGMRCAGLARTLEKSLRFTTTGRVQGRWVQRARIPLLEACWGVFVLRDEAGIVRLAAFSREPTPCRRRDAPHDSWTTNVLDDAAAVASRLRSAGLLDAGDAGWEGGTVVEVERLRAAMRVEGSTAGLEPPPGSRVVEARRVAPGRASGRVALGPTDAAAERLDGRVLVVARLAPQEYPKLYRASAIVATGGSALSHAALVANQLAKPALVVSGVWEGAPGGRVALRLPAVEQRHETRLAHGLRISIRTEGAERDEVLHDGDLVVVDADGERLEVLGQDASTLALHDDLSRLGTELLDLSAARDARDILLRRGRSLRTLRRLATAIAALGEPLLACHVVHELVLGVVASPAAACSEARSDLLRRLLANPRVGDAARERLQRIRADLARGERAARERALRRIGDSGSIVEVLALRLDAIRASDTAEAARRALAEAGLPAPPPGGGPHGPSVDRAARRRLHRLRSDLARRLRGPGSRACAPEARRAVEQIERLDALLAVSPPRRRATAHRRDVVARAADRACWRLGGHMIVRPEDGGAELEPLVGPKAANLAEMARVLGPSSVPAWFAVTDHAFRRMLGTPAADAAAASLGDAVAAIAQRADLASGARSAGIRRLFEAAPIPGDVATEIRAAYASLGRRGDAGGREPFVAVRSSAFEEDQERESRAGEFDTFLYVRGADELLRHVRLAWAGLWTERAIHRRELLGVRSDAAGGGVIVQRIVAARVSGVVQTRSAAPGETRELVVEAGLGLGEGVVSGAVATDEVRVLRGDGGPRRVRYVTRDKTEQVVFDRTSGFGTVRVPTKYHQRLRPALEYVELDELVRRAERLEEEWGIPLDLEFAFEEDRLCLLQARPLAPFLAALRETLERHPLAAPARRHPKEDRSP
jgi:pyruvate,water dikinase